MRQSIAGQSTVDRRSSRLGLVLLVALSWGWAAPAAGLDCNSNGEDDAGEVASGASLDCNGNGVPDECDVVSTLSLLNTTADSIPSAWSASAIVSFDLDGDGHLDIAVGGSTAVRFHLGSGDGGFDFFSTEIVLPRDQAGGLAPGDFNRDGVMDIAVGSQEESDVTVFLQGEDGSLAPSPRYPVRSRPQTIETERLDADEWLDIVVAHREGISVFMGKGGGVFGEEIPIATGFAAADVAVADLDGDAVPDLAATHEGGDEVLVFRGSGDGSFGEAQRYLTARRSPRSIVAVDLDLDGAVDLATANTIGNDVTVFRNAGDGTFDEVIAHRVGGEPEAIDSGDFNADGDADLVVSTESGIAILTGNGDGTLQAPRSLGLFFGRGLAVVADFDDSGTDDIAIAARGGNDLWAFSSVIRPPVEADCNENGVPDRCDIDGGESADQNQDGTPDECTGEDGIPFRRGDPNEDERVNLTDGIVIMRSLFRGSGIVIRCRDAADTDDSGDLNLTDGIFLLNALFRDGGLPPAPFERCGRDPTRDPLDCGAFDPCA